MTAEPSAAALIATLSRLTDGLGGIERRKMFDYPALFINGNMFAGLMRYTMALRLPETNRQSLIDSGDRARLRAFAGLARDRGRTKIPALRSPNRLLYRKVIRRCDRQPERLV